jgi:hypothetical protein
MIESPLLLPLAEIALPPVELQIRAIHADWIEHLTETDPDEWDPIEVCPWPDWARREQSDGAHAPYLVVGGVHRIGAARELGREQVRVHLLATPVNELDYRREAFRSNQRHGERMSASELVAHARYLHRADPARSESDLAREMGVNRSTLHNWLSGRDTNAGRSVRDALNEQRHLSASGNSVTSIPSAWRTAPTANLSMAQSRAVERAISEALAADPSATLQPADVLAWAEQLQAARRHMLAKGTADLAAFWAQVSRVLSAPPSEGA